MNEPSSTGFASRIGAVTLRVRDLDRAAAFYRDVIGLPVRRSAASMVALGTEDEDLIVLEAAPGPLQNALTTGLYHIALLVPSRADLARQLLHLAKLQTPLQGLSDHAVSEAIYLADPEGNGIEIYADRPRDAWPFDASGLLQMTTDPLNVDDLLSVPDANAPFDGMPRGTVVGHIHLRVSDLAAAENFYRDTLGMTVTTRYGNAASFLSYDGYHHHLGLNTWGSLNAPPARIGSAGLKHFVIRAPHDVRAGELRDPSGNQIIIQHQG